MFDSCLKMTALTQEMEIVEPINSMHAFSTKITWQIKASFHKKDVQV